METEIIVSLRNPSDEVVCSAQFSMDDPMKAIEKAREVYDKWHKKNES